MRLITYIYDWVRINEYNGESKPTEYVTAALMQSGFEVNAYF